MNRATGHIPLVYRVYLFLEFPVHRRLRGLRTMGRLRACFTQHHETAAALISIADEHEKARTFNYLWCLSTEDSRIHILPFNVHMSHCVKIRLLFL